MLPGISLLVLCLLHQTTGQIDYNLAIHNSILFYEAERSGYLPDNNRIPWRGDSALGDSSNEGLDLTGGWYDAGDHVKFGFPLAWSVSTLAMGVYFFRDAYSQAGELDAVLDSLKWPLDYFIKCHPQDNFFYGQVGDGNADHAFWGRAEDMTMARPAFAITEGQPGSDLAGETSAAMAAGSLIFRATDPVYADTLLDHSIRLHEFAYNFRGIYSDSIPAQDFYGSTGYTDELAWSSIWLYLATNNQMYMDRAREFYTSGAPWAFSWDDKMAGVQVLMFHATGEEGYRQDVQGFLRSWASGGSVDYTPLGLAFRDIWGPLRYAANTAAIAVVAAELGIDADANIDWAWSQIDYMITYKYVVGYGTEFPLRPHHRSASCHPDHSVNCDWEDHNKPGPNGSNLTGALVGGPDIDDDWDDDRTDYIKNEVACDYNAGFQTALAGLAELDGQKERN